MTIILKDTDNSEVGELKFDSLQDLYRKLKDTKPSNFFLNMKLLVQEMNKEVKKKFDWSCDSVNCVKEIKHDESIIQVRKGNAFNTGSKLVRDFEAEEDVAYYHRNCFKDQRD